MKTLSTTTNLRNKTLGNGQLHGRRKTAPKLKSAARNSSSHVSLSIAEPAPKALKIGYPESSHGGGRQTGQGWAFV